MSQETVHSNKVCSTCESNIKTLIAFVELVKAHESRLVKTKNKAISTPFTSQNTVQNTNETKDEDPFSDVFIKCEPFEQPSITLKETLGTNPFFEDSSSDAEQFEVETKKEDLSSVSSATTDQKTDAGKVIAKLTFICAVCKRSHRDFATLSSHVMAKVSLHDIAQLYELRNISFILFISYRTAMELMLPL